MKSLIAIGAVCALLLSMTPADTAFGQEKKKFRPTWADNWSKKKSDPGGEGGAWKCQPDGRGGLKNCVKQQP